MGGVRVLGVGFFPPPLPLRLIWFADRKNALEISCGKSTGATPTINRGERDSPPPSTSTGMRDGEEVNSRGRYCNNRAAMPEMAGIQRTGTV